MKVQVACRRLMLSLLLSWLLQRALELERRGSTPGIAAAARVGGLHRRVWMCRCCGRSFVGWSGVALRSGGESGGGSGGANEQRAADRKVERERTKGRDDAKKRPQLQHGGRAREQVTSKRARGKEEERRRRAAAASGAAPEERSSRAQAQLRQAESIASCHASGKKREQTQEMHAGKTYNEDDEIGARREEERSSICLSLKLGLGECLVGWCGDAPIRLPPLHFASPIRVCGTHRRCFRLRARTAQIRCSRSPGT